MKKKLYNIIFNYKPPQSDEIVQHQDFEALLAQHQAQQPVAKAKPVRWLSYAGGAIAAALIGVLLYISLRPAPALSGEAYFAQRDYVWPPLADIKPDYSYFAVNANEGGVFEYESGSRLIVPKAAFVNDRGRLIEGEVQIRYREFHDFVDFFLAGIPMAYDSAGQQYQLESAGMVEIYAEQNGQRVHLAPEAEIEVELRSEINMRPGEKPRYNIYRLDEEQRNWVYLAPDQIELLEADTGLMDIAGEGTEPQAELQQKLAKIAAEEAQEYARIEASVPKPDAPLKPEKAGEEAITFEFDFGTLSGAPRLDNQEELKHHQAATKVAELRRQYEGVVWQLKAGQEHHAEALANVTWNEEQSQLRQLNEQDYQLTLTSGTRKLELIVQPVLLGQDYEAALSTFNAAFAGYQQEMARREAQLAEKRQALEKRIAEQKALANAHYQEKIDRLRAQGRNDEATAMLIRRKILNRFSITEMGIWNCDRPLPPWAVSLNANFVDQARHDISGQPAFLVSKSRNTVVRFFAGPGSQVNFSHDEDHLMWLVTKENKLAVFEPEQFKAIDQTRGDYTFVMKVVDAEMQSEEDVREVLGF